MSVRQRTGLLVLGRAPAHGVAACRRRALLRCKRRCCATATAAAQQAGAGSETVSHLRHPHRESEVWLVGTSHVSQESVDEVASLIETLRPSQVMVELCPGRARQLLASHGQTEGAAPPPPGLLDLAAGVFSAAGAGGAAGAGLGAYGAVLRGLGMDPGQELRAAMLSAAALEIPVLYGDRPVEQTLARLRQALTPGELMHMMGAAMGGEGREVAALNARLLTSSNITAAQEAMKNRATVRALVDVMRRSAPGLVEVMLGERDVLMADALAQLPAGSRTVAVPPRADTSQ